jgi:TPR repeat protein
MLAGCLALSSTAVAQGPGDGEFTSSIEDHDTWLHVIEGEDHALFSYSGMFGPGCSGKANAGWCRTCEMGFTRAEREGPGSYLASDEFGRTRLRREGGAWRLQTVEGQTGWCGVGWTGDVFGPDGTSLDACTVVSADARWYAVGKAGVDVTGTEIASGSPVLAIASPLESDHTYVIARAGRTVGLLKRADLRCEGSGVGVWPPEEVQAVAVHRQACDGGDVKGCDALGKAYELGRGVAEDRDQAMALYHRACDGGSAKGCDHLGRMYHLGIGVVVNNARALALFEKACDGGEAAACRSLGEMYWRGTGVAKDEARAVTLFKRACDGADADGCGRLGLMYDVGIGVAKDELRALALYEQACDGGHTSDCTKVGEAYERGDGRVKDAARAAALYKQACDGGDAEGCAGLERFRR